MIVGNYKNTNLKISLKFKKLKKYFKIDNLKKSKLIYC